MPENSQQALDWTDVLRGDPEDAPPSGPCPDAETIGALIEGTLAAEERDGVEEHLAACERCYEGYATAMTFLAEEGREEAEAPAPEATVTPFRPAAKGSKPLGPAPRWLLAAAALALISTSGFWYVQSQRFPSQKRLIAELEGNPAVAGQLWDTDNKRGPDDHSDDQETAPVAFQIGALAFDLQVAVEHGETKVAGHYADSLSSLVELQISQSSSRLSKSLKSLSGRLETVGGAKTAPLERETADVVAELEERTYSKSAFALGRLLEAARIAAGLKDEALLHPERLLHALDRWKEEGRVDEDSTEAFAALQVALRARPLDFDTVRLTIVDFERAYGHELIDPSELDDLDLDSLDEPPTPTPPQPGK